MPFLNATSHTGTTGELRGCGMAVLSYVYMYGINFFGHDGVVHV